MDTFCIKYRGSCRSKESRLHPQDRGKGRKPHPTQLYDCMCHSQATWDEHGWKWDERVNGHPTITVLIPDTRLTPVNGERHDPQDGINMVNLPNFWPGHGSFSVRPDPPPCTQLERTGVDLAPIWVWDFMDIYYGFSWIIIIKNAITLGMPTIFKHTSSMLRASWFRWFLLSGRFSITFDNKRKWWDTINQSVWSFLQKSSY